MMLFRVRGQMRDSISARMYKGVERVELIKVHPVARYF